MSNIKILDCTLRDGGYVNDFDFGSNNIAKILLQLQNAGIDIVECGFLEDGEYDPNASVFNAVEQIAALLPQKRNDDTMYVAMACYGEYSLSRLSPCDGSSVTGIRVTFHYNEVDAALDYCREVKRLGYKVFVQPVGTSSYTDAQLLKLILEVNKIKPYAFYLVDTLGLMVQRDIARFFYLIDHNLDADINFGFHSHNNLQLSFSNCQYIASLNTKRTISLDASVYGMGRGAGNLNTELIANYLNIYNGANYRIEPILQIVDEVISKIKSKYDWGYNDSFYLAAINGCHPNYAAYLSNKHTLTIREIATILRSIDTDSRALFDKDLVEKKYIEFQSIEVDDSLALKSLSKALAGRNVLLLGPGASIHSHKDEINEYINLNNPMVICVGFVPDCFDADFIFISNIRRYLTSFVSRDINATLINTSNISVTDKLHLTFNYSSLLDENPIIADNSLIMMLNILAKTVTSQTIALAGFDGYCENGRNYYSDTLELGAGRIEAGEINRAISLRLRAFLAQLSITWITPTAYIS